MINTTPPPPRAPNDLAALRPPKEARIRNTPRRSDVTRLAGARFFLRVWLRQAAHVDGDIRRAPLAHAGNTLVAALSDARAAAATA
jgi:hypothetical protein